MRFKYVLRRLNTALSLGGINIRMLYFSVRGLVPFFQDYFRIRNLLKKGADFSITSFYPCLADRWDHGGVCKGHYFHQDLVVAQRIYKKNPERHVDIASRVDGFVAHVATFRKIEVFDIRPIASKVENLVFRQADMMNLSEDLYDYCDSLSSLHAIEHFGLGRYGDPLDLNGHLKALENVYKILKANGKFYFSVPIGRQRIEFNAHRVFSIEYLLRIFEGKFEVDDFSYVNDAGDLIEHAGLDSEQVKTNYGCEYGCGIFELTKIR